MALRGVWQLQKLVVNYCDWGGSSRGIRAFMETHLPAFKEKNPHLEVVTALVRGQHPNLKGIYKNHNERVVCVRNLAPEDILLQATRLRNSLGRKVVKLRTRHVTKRPSVQGTWTTELKIEGDRGGGRTVCKRKSTRAAPKSAALVPSCTDATHGTDVVEQTGWEGL